MYNNSAKLLRTDKIHSMFPPSGYIKGNKLGNSVIWWSSVWWPPTIWLMKTPILGDVSSTPSFQITSPQNNKYFQLTLMAVRFRTRHCPSRIVIVMHPTKYAFKKQRSSMNWTDRVFKEIVIAVILPNTAKKEGYFSCKANEEKGLNQSEKVLRSQYDLRWQGASLLRYSFFVY